MIIFSEAHLRPPQWPKSASLEAESLVCRHQLNVLSRKLRPLRGASARLNGKTFCDIFNSLN
jgi:hypothetical protein